MFTVANTGMPLRLAFKVKYALTSVMSVGCVDDWIYSCLLFSVATHIQTRRLHEFELFVMMIVYLNLIEYLILILPQNMLLEPLAPSVLCLTFVLMKFLM